MPPGNFVATVGPSGAGKNTLIGRAREAPQDDPRHPLPRPARSLARGGPPAERRIVTEAAPAAAATRLIAVLRGRRPTGPL